MRASPESSMLLAVAGKVAVTMRLDVRACGETVVN